MCRTSVRRPKVTISLGFDGSSISLQTNANIRNMLNRLYDDGNLPDGIIHIEQRDNYLVVVDLYNNTDIAHIANN